MEAQNTFSSLPTAEPHAGPVDAVRQEAVHPRSPGGVAAAAAVATEDFHIVCPGARLVHHWRVPSAVSGGEKQDSHTAVSWKE